MVGSTNLTFSHPFFLILQEYLIFYLHLFTYYLQVLGGQPAWVIHIYKVIRRGRLLCVVVIPSATLAQQYINIAWKSYACCLDFADGCQTKCKPSAHTGRGIRHDMLQPGEIKKKPEAASSDQRKRKHLAGSVSLL